MEADYEQRSAFRIMGDQLFSPANPDTALYEVKDPDRVYDFHPDVVALVKPGLGRGTVHVGDVSQVAQIGVSPYLFDVSAEYQAEPSGWPSPLHITAMTRSLGASALRFVLEDLSPEAAAEVSKIVFRDRMRKRASGQRLAELESTPVDIDRITSEYLSGGGGDGQAAGQRE